MMLNLKEKRDIHLIRMRIHYVNCNEKSILRVIRSRVELETGFDDVHLSVTQRRLNIRMNNTWVDLGPAQSVNLAAPLKTGPTRQVLEACANLKVDDLLADPMICLLF